MFVGIAVLSASLLAFQVLLTRLCALRLAFHFGFLIISNSLLGIGASGSVLTLLEGRWRRNPEAWVFGASVAYVVSLGATWAFARAMPVPDVLTFGMTGVELRQFAKFAVFNLGLAVPFFFGGGAVGLILSTYAHRVNSVYASDLLGAGIGCLLCPMLLWPFGAGGCLCALAALGLLACAFVAPGRLRRPATVAALAGVVGLLAWMPSFDATFPVPGKKFLQVTRNQRVDLTGDHEFSRWSANSRIDVRRSPLPNWYCYGLGGKDRPFVFDPRNQARLGGQKWIMQDGDAGTFLTDYTNTEVGRDYLLRSLYALSGTVKKGSAPRVFVIGVGGGPDLWAHKLLGASYVKGIELNRGVLEVHETIGREFSRGLREDPNVEFVCDEGRSALMHDPARYDVIQMTGIDTWTSLASGAYVLAENYLYTVEAVQQMYAHLADGGILQITRMGADPEKLRLLVNVHHALLAMGAGDLQASVAVIGSPVDGLTAILVKKGAYTEQEVSRLEQFCGASGHQLQYLPLRTLDGNVVEQFLRRPDKDAFVRAYPRRITPTTDDQPYFFNFTRWDTPTAETKKLLAELVEVSQGNPLFLWGQLGFSTIVALLLIVVPLWFRRSKARGYHLAFPRLLRGHRRRLHLPRDRDDPEAHAAARPAALLDRRHAAVDPRVHRRRQLPVGALARGRRVARARDPARHRRGHRGDRVVRHRHRECRDRARPVRACGGRRARDRADRAAARHAVRSRHRAAAANQPGVRALGVGGQRLRDRRRFGGHRDRVDELRLLRRARRRRRDLPDRVRRGRQARALTRTRGRAQGARSGSGSRRGRERDDAVIRDPIRWSPSRDLSP
jgi:spermidine synthase